MHGPKVPYAVLLKAFRGPVGFVFPNMPEPLAMQGHEARGSQLYLAPGNDHPAPRNVCRKR
jgi:hypothetical protein